MSRAHRPRDQVFAVVRVDPGAGPPEEQVTVKEVVWSQEEAEAEVARLSALNGAKECRYFWQVTRLFAAGTSAGTGAPSDA